MANGTDNKLYVREEIRDSKDIHKVFDTVHRASHLLNISTAELTVFLTSASEVYRSFLTIFNVVHTEITALENSRHPVFDMLVLGKGVKKSTDSVSADHLEIRRRLNSELKRVKPVFDNFVLEFDEKNIATLTLEKRFTGSGIGDI